MAISRGSNRSSASRTHAKAPAKAPAKAAASKPAAEAKAPAKSTSKSKSTVKGYAQNDSFQAPAKKTPRQLAMDPAQRSRLGFGDRQANAALRPGSSVLGGMRAHQHHLDRQVASKVQIKQPRALASHKTIADAMAKLGGQGIKLSQQVSGLLSGTEPAFQDSARAIQKSADAVGRTIQGGLQALSDTPIQKRSEARQILGRVQHGVDAEMKQLEGHKLRLAEGLDAAAKNVKTQFEAAHAGIAKQAERGIVAVKDPVDGVDEAAKTIDKQTGGRLDAIEGHLSDIHQTFDKGAEGIRGHLKGIQDEVGQVFGGIGKGLSGIKDEVVGAIDDFKGTVQDIWQGIRGKVEDTLETVKDGVAGTWDRFTGGLQKLGHKGREAIENAGKAAGQILENGGKAAGDLLEAGGAWLGDKARKTGEKLGEMAEVTGKRISEMGTWVGDRIDEVRQFGEDAAATIKAQGTELLDGARRGLEHLQEGAEAAGKAIVDGLNAGAKAAVKPFVDLGKDALGIVGQAGGAIRDFGQGLESAAKEGAKWLDQFGKDPLKTVNQGLLGLSDAAPVLGDAISKAIETVPKILGDLTDDINVKLKAKGLRALPKENKFFDTGIGAAGGFLARTFDAWREDGDVSASDIKKVAVDTAIDTSFGLLGDKLEEKITSKIGASAFAKSPLGGKLMSSAAGKAGASALSKGIGGGLASGATELVIGGREQLEAYQRGDVTGPQAIGNTLGSAAVSAATGAAGAAAGAAIGSFIPIPIVGTVAGAAIGFGLDYAASNIKIGDKTAKEWAQQGFTKAAETVTEVAGNIKKSWDNAAGKLKDGVHQIGEGFSKIGEGIGGLFGSVASAFR